MIRLRTLIEKNRNESRKKIVSSTLDSLPEGCISNIISFTSPEDACVAAAVSKIFESAVKSDIVWEKFLPADYESLIPPLRAFSSKKELYFSLCSDPLLIEDGKMSLWLEKASGKRCIMLSATAMNLSSMADMSQRFLWIPCPESRFETVAALREAYRFEFNCRMNTRVLSPRTRYSVYIVFKKADNWCGFKGVSIEAVVGIVGEESFRSFICFDTHGKGQARKRKVVAKPELREDGWMETEIGEFYNEGGLMSSDEVEISTVEGKYAQQKRGLVILGIEIRPAKILEEFSVCRL
ncbi:F-box protein SKIP3 [Arabidopsis thaliana]|uniref:SKIP3 n=1 Tax=Arabidopsis thaliana TaxID=3702 RepID=A0A178VUH2_ARATH|nr:SKIP3 [Arabidopsis thaliana]